MLYTKVIQDTSSRNKGFYEVRANAICAGPTCLHGSYLLVREMLYTTVIQDTSSRNKGFYEVRASAISVMQIIAQIKSKKIKNVIRVLLVGLQL